MTESVLIHNISFEELKSLLAGTYIVDEIIDLEINAKQAQKILDCSYKTLMSYIEKEHLHSTGGKRPLFNLKEVIELKQSKLKYKRFSNLK